MYKSIKWCQVFIIVTMFIKSMSQDPHLNCGIYCSGNILHYVQMSRIFNDSKYFVDMKLKHPQDIITKKFDSILRKTNFNPDKQTIQQFVDDNFLPPGYDLQKWHPTDWVAEPAFTKQISDHSFRQWALDINLLWWRLSRKIPIDVSFNSDLYSLIYIPFPFIVPGGRFREFYYWDTFWILDGLLLCDMVDSARYILKNIFCLVDAFGYVPNGNRKYYLGRSQPPFLIPMFDLYYKKTQNKLFLSKNIALLEKEFQFWFINRSAKVYKNGNEYSVFHYHVKSKQPRPESYYDDVTNAKSFKSNSSKQRFYSEIKSAAETGWDFSSRWFINKVKHTNHITDTHPSTLAPVSLNSLIGYNANLLSKFYSELGYVEKSIFYADTAARINRTITELFWNDEVGIWNDFNLASNELEIGFYLSNFMPLWTEMYGYNQDRDVVVNKVLNYIQNLNILTFPGGIPTSLYPSNEQWDFPDGWAPLQYIIIMGLQKTGNSKAEDMAASIAEKWLINCFEAYQNSDPHRMFEKYIVTTIGVPGSGGEYNLQEGFGWTNGVVLRLLQQYGHKIHYNENNLYMQLCAIIIICLLLILFYVLVIKFSFSPYIKLHVRSFARKFC